ncbi:hypothetical protein D3C80_1065040 [compost metagenome]
MADIHRTDLDAVTTGILKNLVGTVKAHRPAVDQRTGVDRRFMALEPATGVGQQGKTGGVGFGKAITAKALDLLEDPLGEFAAVAIAEHAADQPFAVWFQAAMTFPGSHGPPQLIGLARRIAARDHGQLHHLLLEQRHAEGALEDFFQRR